MAELSPAAQAIWEAFNEDEAGVFVDYGEKLAAAIEALADQVVPHQSEPPCGEDWPWPPAYQQMSDAKWEQRQQTRSEILAIAAELRGQDQTTKPMTEHKATPEQWVEIEAQVKDYPYATETAVLELRARVEALEAAQRSITQRSSARIHLGLGRDASDPVPGSAGSLVDLVLAHIENGIACDRESARIARAAILKIAAWVDRLGYHSCATELRKEVPQSTP